MPLPPLHANGAPSRLALPLTLVGARAGASREGGCVPPGGRAPPVAREPPRPAVRPRAPTERILYEFNILYNLEIFNLLRPDGSDAF